MGLWMAITNVNVNSTYSPQSRRETNIRLKSTRSICNYCLLNSAGALFCPHNCITLQIIEQKQTTPDFVLNVERIAINIRMECGVPVYVCSRERVLMNAKAIRCGIWSNVVSQIGVVCSGYLLIGHSDRRFRLLSIESKFNVLRNRRVCNEQSTWALMQLFLFEA